MLDALPDLLTRHRYARAFALAAAAGAIGLLLTSVAQLIWVILDASTPLPQSVTRLSTPLASNAPAPGALSRWHIFGSNQLVLDPRSLALSAPDTSLQLNLRGIFAGDDPKNGYAIIADGNGADQVYHPGDALPGGASIDSIYSDRVMLSRSGTLEALRLPEERRKSAGASNTAANGGRSPASAAMAPVSAATATAATPFVNPNIVVAGPAWNAASQAINTDVANLARQVSVMPVLENGRFVGVRLSGGREQALLAKLGLRPDDVVTSINGIPLDSPTRAAEVAKSLENARNAAVVVRRNGKEEKLSVSLN